MHPDRTVGLVVESSPDYVTRIFASWQRDEVVVPLRSADDGYRRTIGKVGAVLTAAAGSGWLEGRLEPRSDDVPAQILFTSGTEGEPKGVVLTHKNLADVVTRLNAVMKVTSEIREYVGVPVVHSFGFGRCRAVCAAGGRAFLPARGFNPVEINTMLEAGEINAISAVPSLWRILLQTQAITPRAAQRVRWIEIGSQYMSAAEKESLKTLFSKAIIVQHYGLTEASRSTFLEVHSAPAEHLESVGRPFGDVELAIAADGRVKIRGPHVAGLMLMGESTSTDPRDVEGWLTTNDLGELREGYLYYKGRADDVINCGGLKLSPDAIETSMRAALGGAGELAVCRVPNAVRGDGILVAATLETPATDGELMEAVVEAAGALGVNARGATHVMRVASLPRTDNGKVKRGELAKMFSLAPEPTALAAPNGKGLRAQLGTILGVRDVGDGDTFINLGGDSLRYIQASVVLERQLGYLPPDWEKRPFAELELLKPKRGGLSQLEPSVILRAVAILAVVVNHAGAFEALFPIDGAAFMLLLPSGFSFARFQLQRVIESGRAHLALAALPRVILPAVLLVGVQQLRHHDFVPSALLLYNNLLNPPDVFSYWFIEVFVQLHLIIALLLTVRWVRSSLRDRAWATSLVAVLASALLTVVVPFVWNTDHLYNLVPHHVLWYFFLGWCLLFAKQPWQRWVNSALIVGLAVAQLPQTSKTVWIFLGGMFLNWAPTLRLPAPVTRAVSVLASASLYIYTSHFLILGPVAAKLPQAGFVGPVIVAVVFGIVFWFCFERAWQLGVRLLNRRSATPAASPTP